jgi:hypothetical protein
VDTQDLSVKELRQFGLIMGGMIALMFGLVIPWLWSAAAWPWWPWAVGALFVAWALALPATLAPVYRGWMKLAAVLAWINTRLILGIAFYLVILPISLVLRLRRDPMARKYDPNAVSYRIKKNPRPHNQMEKPF